MVVAPLTPRRVETPARDWVRVQKDPSRRENGMAAVLVMVGVALVGAVIGFTMIVGPNQRRSSWRSATSMATRPRSSSLRWWPERSP